MAWTYCQLRRLLNELDNDVCMQNMTMLVGDESSGEYFPCELAVTKNSDVCDAGHLYFRVIPAGAADRSTAEVLQDCGRTVISSDRTREIAYDIAHWLTKTLVYAASPASITIRGVKLPGVMYRPIDSYKADDVKLYIVDNGSGLLPKLVKSSDVYRLNTEDDWYISLHQMGPIQPSQASYHPHGKNVVISQWKGPSSIDDDGVKRERKQIEVEFYIDGGEYFFPSVYREQQ